MPLFPDTGGLNALAVAVAVLSCRLGGLGATGRASSGTGDLNKPVQSILERRYANIERQHTDFSCGAAAVATILRYAYGHATNERWVMDGMLAMADPEQVKHYGFSMLDMKQYLQMLGMRVRGYRLGDENCAR